MEQVGRDRPVNDTQNLTHRMGMGSEQVPKGEGKTDHPLAKRYIGKHFIREKGRCLGHAAGATTGAETPLLTRKRYEPLEVAFIAAYAQEPVLEATAFEIRFKLPMDMSRQTFALKFQLLNQGGIVFLYKLVEQSLFWAMAIIGGVTKGMPINRGSPSFAW